MILHLRSATSVSDGLADTNVHYVLTLICTSYLRLCCRFNWYTCLFAGYYSSAM